MLGVIEEAKSLLINGKCDFLCFARSQFHLLETFQFLDGTRQRGLLVTDVQLDNFLPFARSGILYRNLHGQRTVGLHGLAVGCGLAILESGIAQTVAEGEQRFHLLLLIGPTVTYKNTFIIFDVDDVLAPLAGIFTQAVGRAILQLHGEGKRKLATGIHIPHKDSGESTASFGTQIPVLNDSRHLVHPRHGNGVAGDVDDNQILVRLGQCGDNGILTVGQAQTLTVGVLAVLAVALVQAADEDDIIGIPGLFHGFSYQLFGSTVILQILSGHHPVVFTACIAHVATGIDHLGLAGHTLLDAVQRREFALYLQGRTTTAYGHHLDGILAHYKNLFSPVQVYREHIALVLQQYDALLTDAAGSLVMFRREHASPRTVGVHHRTEDKAQNAAYLVVQFRGTYLTFADEVQIGICQIIVIVCVAGTVREPVGPTAEFHIQPVGDGLPGIVRAAPVGNDYAVESPFALQYIIQCVLVVTKMLAFV